MVTRLNSFSHIPIFCIVSLQERRLALHLFCFVILMFASDALITKSEIFDMVFLVIAVLKSDMFLKTSHE